VGLIFNPSLVGALSLECKMSCYEGDMSSCPLSLNRGFCAGGMANSNCE